MIIRRAKSHSHSLFNTDTTTTITTTTNNNSISAVATYPLNAVLQHQENVALLSLSKAAESTHYYGTSPRSGSFIMACSPILVPLDITRPLLADKKRPFAHLKPRALGLSAVRTVAQQAGLFVLNFFTDQLEYEQKNTELVYDGKLTAHEAEMDNEEWEKTEWSHRKALLPQKTIIAFFKLQSSTLLMRFYEYLASRYISTAILDKLTMDVFKASKRNQSLTKSPSSSATFKTMYSTCLWANAIAFLADGTVQQVIFISGYWVYLQKRRRKRKKSSGGKKEDTAIGGEVLNVVLKSMRLTVARASAWVVSSVGGALGSVAYPGYGTIFGIQLGDSIVSSLLMD
eukprot:CAMPEP_0172489688 /NCGR_PEP_ID=MMETSP1066-20121228/19870_1 /TAXON_ID=671091 /ORGANISM="Coscinodiscus wailesii, Strain CCMP2513" /LENGTH=342 /DNA_ID=CAMNT_0013257745 /DNA_START=181 /DNA_END=1209 /DNA_ORIENTATION=-